MSTLTISIDRTSLALAPLVMSAADDETPLGITDYQEPAIQPRITYAPDSAYVSGSRPLARVWQQSILGWEVVTDHAESEDESRDLIAELMQAVSQFAFTTTVVVDGAPPETWTCHTGTLTPTGSRTLSNLENHDPTWSVTIPVHPVRAS